MIRAIRRRGKTIPAGVRAAQWMGGLASGLFLLFTAGLFFFIFSVAGPYGLVFGIPPFFKFLLVLPVLAAALTVGMLIFTVLAWKEGYWETVGRVFYTFVAAAAVAFTWSLNFLNLFGWRY